MLVDGREVRREGTGDFFGEIALLRDEPRTATVRAISDVDLRTLERDEFVAAVTATRRARPPLMRPWGAAAVGAAGDSSGVSVTALTLRASRAVTERGERGRSLRPKPSPRTIEGDGNPGQEVPMPWAKRRSGEAAADAEAHASRCAAVRPSSHAEARPAQAGRVRPTAAGEEPAKEPSDAQAHEQASSTVEADEEPEVEAHRRKFHA